MNFNENDKVVKITSEDVYNKKFSQTNSNGYDPDEVDEFLDLIVKKLYQYEKNLNRYLTSINNFASISEKTSQQDALIKKLQKELDDLYNNGYGNQAMMRRMQNIEQNVRERNTVFNEKLERIEHMLSKVLKKLEIY
ncbi:DivIVA domain-containing protein [Mycoplasmoides pirum]|uniref:DivIVA domain-containing protein n=1 Tax=Mycoplasmoides pirum TaxID=2122 RepID=UPI000565B91D|nr:DivIVA domain-containing protein [Mycoplasmoides pirum]